MKEKLLMQIKYKKGLAKFVQRLLPSTHHLPNDVQPCDGYVISHGTVERNGIELDFEEVRLYYPRS